MGQVLKWFNWRGLLGDQAWLTEELAPKMGLSLVCTRRYLRMAYFLGVLERKRWGRYWYYVLADALDEYKVKICLNCGRLIIKWPCVCGARIYYDAVIPKDHEFSALLDRVMKEHKPVLDALAKYDGMGPSKPYDPTFGGTLES